MAHSARAAQKAKKKAAPPVRPEGPSLGRRIRSLHPTFVLAMVACAGLVAAALFLTADVSQQREISLVALGGFALSGIVLMFSIAWLSGGWRLAKHAAFVLASLDLIGFCIALLLSYEELRPHGVVPCPASGALSGCRAVQNSQYSRPFFNIPVAVYGVALSLTLLTLAVAWWRTGEYKLLLAHYGLSLVGVAFEGWFQFAQVFLIGAFCVWCESYGISLVLRFLIALWVYLRTPNPDALATQPSRETG
jgi:uncharacterized membrane protein